MTHVPEYYVGIGASAGGLEALEQFFRKLPSSNGWCHGNMGFKIPHET